MKKWIQLNLLLLVAVVGVFAINSSVNAKTWKSTVPTYLRGNWEEYPSSGHAIVYIISHHQITAGMTQQDAYPYKIIRTIKKGRDYYIKGYLSLGHVYATFKFKRISPTKLITPKGNGGATILHKVKHIIQFY
jgi:hypothetical protein